MGDDSGRLIAEVTGINGAHGTALAPGTGHGFATSGNDSSIVMFDLKTYKTLGKIPAAEDADAIIYDPSSKRVFSFKYGYDLAAAPTDREAYKKFLADQRLLNVTLDRQRGAAWYLEGTDGLGVASFRTVVVYGGKRLVCGGSLFKDKESVTLGPGNWSVVGPHQTAPVPPTSFEDTE